MSCEKNYISPRPLVEHCTVISNHSSHGLTPCRMTCIRITSGELNSNALQDTHQRCHELNYLMCGDLVPPFLRRLQVHMYVAQGLKFGDPWGWRLCTVIASTSHDRMQDLKRRKGTRMTRGNPQSEDAVGRHIEAAIKSSIFSLVREKKSP